MIRVGIEIAARKDVPVVWLVISLDMKRIKSCADVVELLAI
jgi:hypothetical protein